jgi:hypothetical protein
MSKIVSQTVRFVVVASLLAGLFVVAPAPRALAATFDVDRTDDNATATACTVAPNDCSLRGAIIKANTTLGDDVITLSANTYTLTLVGADENNAATGDLDITDNLTISGVAADATIIDAGGIDRVFHITTTSITVAISDVTIRGGHPPDVLGFVNNGGGIFNAGKLTLTNSVISNNTTQSAGGAILSDTGSTLTIRDSKISDNTSRYGSSGILNYGNTLIDNSTLSNNSTDSGGAIWNNGVLRIETSTLSGNTVSLWGGAIRNDNGSVLTVVSSTINNNSANIGSGLINFGGTVVLANATVSGNTTSSGIFNQAGSMSIYNSTISANTNGGLGYFSGTISLANAILAGNSGYDCWATVNSQGNNLIQDTANCTIVGVTSSNIIGADPMLDALADNGGPTQTMALLAGSLAINAGNNAICAADPVNNLDQRGIARPSGLVCDIGAYEFGQDSPDPNFPASGNAPPTARPLFDWANVATATSYTLQISTNQNFTSLVLNALITPSAYVPTADLPRNTLLFWRVRANGPGGPSAWSRVRHFYSANPPGVPTLLAPANGATVASNQPALDWNDVAPAASYYEVQISTDPNFTAVLGRGQGGRVNLSQYTPEVALGSGPFYWRVRAVSGGAGGGMQFSQWSVARSFNTPP